MSNWINYYLTKFHADNTDSIKAVSVLSVPTMPASGQNEKQKFNIAGDYLNTSSLNNSNFPGTMRAGTDNTDKEWVGLVKKCVSENKSTKSFLKDFFKKAAELGLDLLPDDKRWLKTICHGVPLAKLRSLLEQYSYLWRTAMAKESLLFKQQNIGRFTANEYEKYFV